MRKIVLGTFVTLDGVMQAPGGKGEDPEGGFEHEGWLVPLFVDAIGEHVMSWMQEADSLLLGRKTYEIFATAWPQAPADDPMAAHLNSVKKYVASRTLDSVEWENSELLQGDAAEAVARLKEESGKDIHVAGSSDLIQTLLKHDLVDEIRMIVFPVVLGTGKKLFGEGTVPAAMRLTSSELMDNGVMVMLYERTGVPEYGTFELAETLSE